MMENENMPHERHTLKPIQYSNARFLKLRNWLNIVFMLLAIVGVIVFLMDYHTAGYVVMIVAVVFKIVETILRFFH